MNRKTVGTFVTGLVMLAMIVKVGDCVQWLFLEENSWTAWPVFNISMILSCMVMSIVIYGSVFVDRNNDENSHRFMLLVLVEFLLLDACFRYWRSRLMDENSYLELSAYSEYFLYGLTLFTFTRYQTSILGMHNRAVRLQWFSALVILGLIIAVLLVNTQTGWMFDCSGETITVSEYAYILVLLDVALVLMGVVTALVYARSLKTKAVMIIYLVVPFLIIMHRYPDNTVYGLIATAVLIYFIYGNTYLERGVTLARNEAELSEQKVAMMTARIEPEFLRESLQSIIDLEGTTPVAKRAIRLFERYFVQNMDTIAEKNPIPIVKELEHVKVYLSLEKLRFKDGLDVRFEVTDTNFEVPAMAVQLLVENAVKHGITQRESGGTVTIRTAEYERSHRVTVIDDGVGFDVNAPRDPEKSHVGIDNLVARLEEMCKGTLEIRSETGKGTIATITIPKI